MCAFGRGLCTLSLLPGEVFTLTPHHTPRCGFILHACNLWGVREKDFKSEEVGGRLDWQWLRQKEEEEAVEEEGEGQEEEEDVAVKAVEAVSPRTSGSGSGWDQKLERKPRERSRRRTNIAANGGSCAAPGEGGFQEGGLTAAPAAGDKGSTAALSPATTGSKPLSLPLMGEMYARARDGEKIEWPRWC